MRELGRESLRKLKPMAFAANQRKLKRAETRQSCRTSSNELYRQAASMAERGYGWEDIQKETDITPDLARALVLGV